MDRFWLQNSSPQDKTVFDFSEAMSFPGMAAPQPEQSKLRGSASSWSPLSDIICNPEPKP